MKNILLVLVVILFLLLVSEVTEFYTFNDFIELLKDFFSKAEETT